MLDSAADLVRHEGFVAGLVFGVLAGTIAVVTARSRRRVLPLAGIAIVVATTFALVLDASVPLVLAAGLVALGGAAAVTRTQPAAIRAVAVLPGALAVMLALDAPIARWAPVLVLTATLAGGFAATDFDRVYASVGLALPVLAVTALGIYFSGPETEQSAVLVGVTLPLVLLGWPRPLASLGAIGAFPTVGLVMWIAATAGRARDGAVIGSMACLGIIVIEPAVRACVRPGRRFEGTGRWAWGILLAVLHGVVVIICSRVAGLRDAAGSSLGVVAVVYGGCAVVLVTLRLALGRSRTETPRG